MASTEQLTAVSGVLDRLGIQHANSGACWGEWIERPTGGDLVSISPIDGTELARIRMAGEKDFDEVVDQAHRTFLKWRMLPAPKRGLIVREIGDELRRIVQIKGRILGELDEMFSSGRECAAKDRFMNEIDAETEAVAP